MNVSRHSWLGIFQRMAVRCDTAVFVSHTSGVLAVSSPGTGSSSSSETITPALISPFFSSSSSSSAGCVLIGRPVFSYPMASFLSKPRKLFLCAQDVFAQDVGLVRHALAPPLQLLVELLHLGMQSADNFIQLGDSVPNIWAAQQQTMQGSERHTVIYSYYFCSVNLMHIFLDVLRHFFVCFYTKLDI